MKLTNKHVKLGVIPNLTRDLRDPRQVHRMKRAKECEKVAPPLELDVQLDQPEQDYGDPRRDYADSVGMRLWEKI